MGAFQLIAVKHTERHIRSIYPLDEGSWLKLKQALTPLSFPKGHLLFRSGRVEPSVYFIERGIARAYTKPQRKEITFGFGQEGDVLLSYNSYIYGKPGYETMELLEDADLYKMDAQTLHTLYAQNLDLANWGRKLAERELVKTEQHFIHLQHKTAKGRYQDLLQNHPNLLRRVPLMHIASYLGVTQVTLSRIRAER